MDGVRVSVDFFTHSKTQKLRDELGDGGVVMLVFLWCWTAQNRPNGVLTGVSKKKLEQQIGWKGETGKLIFTLIDHHWIDVDENGTMSVHNWTKHNGHLVGLGGEDDE